MLPEQAFGMVLRRCRAQAGLTQEELAFRSELDRTFISMLERGERQPTLSTILAIAQNLNVSGSQLISWVEDLLNDDGVIR